MPSATDNDDFEGLDDSNAEIAESAGIRMPLIDDVKRSIRRELAQHDLVYLQIPDDSTWYALARGDSYIKIDEPLDQLLLPLPINKLRAVDMHTEWLEGAKISHFGEKLPIREPDEVIKLKYLNGWKEIMSMDDVAHYIEKHPKFKGLEQNVIRIVLECYEKHPEDTPYIKGLLKELFYGNSHALRVLAYNFIKRYERIGHLENPGYEMFFSQEEIQKMDKVNDEHRKKERKEKQSKRWSEFSEATNGTSILDIKTIDQLAKTLDQYEKYTGIDAFSGITVYLRYIDMLDEDTPDDIVQSVIIPLATMPDYDDQIREKAANLLAHCDYQFVNGTWVKKAQS